MVFYLVWLGSVSPFLLEVIVLGLPGPMASAKKVLVVYVHGSKKQD